jgi:hypothetical protein
MGMLERRPGIDSRYSFRMDQRVQIVRMLGGGGENLGTVASTLPFLFWRVGVAALSSWEPGE